MFEINNLRITVLLTVLLVKSRFIATMTENTLSRERLGFLNSDSWIGGTYRETEFV